MSEEKGAEDHRIEIDLETETRIEVEKEEDFVIEETDQEVLNRMINASIVEDVAIGQMNVKK